MKKLLACCLVAGGIWAQAPASTPKKMAFEVASVKRNTSGDGRGGIDGLGTGPGGRLRVTNIPLRQLILFAYGPPNELGNLFAVPLAISGAPGWINTDRFDIEARAPEGVNPTPEQAQQMLQGLLEDRFGLKIRHETKDVPIYALVVAKDGVKMKLSADQTPVTPPLGAGPGAGPGGPPPPAPTPAISANGPMPRGMFVNYPGQFRASARPVTVLLMPLAIPAGRKVVDRTNLAGLYDIELKWTPDQMPNSANLPPGIQLPAIDPNGPSIFTAVQEQLGLRLESATGPVDSLVIEKVEKPIEN